ncbi:lipopolysaccharide biosynthesis protein [Rhodococcus sp. 14-2470-1a]|uniref:lipopolysaccharide biosynthesis protein n=1 Tax=Rhodococcus sp. 14-2470-1a TaxID=2023150 RepID=UPI0015C58F39|nr:lipopolysaccharide biosynthesis protein [Rhodococcus sp. 14-2470-1a]
MRGQFATLLLSRAFASVSQAVCIILLARWTDPKTFGYVSVAIGVGVVLVAIADLGVGTYVLRARSVDELKGSIAAALRLNLYTSALIVTVATCLILISAVVIDDVFYALIPISIWVAAEKNADIWLNLSVADNKAGHAAFAIVVRRLSALVLFIILDLLRVNPVVSFSASLAAGGLLGLVVSRYLVTVDPCDLSTTKSVLLRTWPYWVTNLTSQMRNLDVVIVGIFASASSAGIYASAVRLTNPILLFTGSLTSVLLPNVSRADLKTVKSYNRRLLVSILVLVPVFFVVGLPISTVGVLLLGDEFQSARFAIYVMLISMIFIGASPACASILQGLDDARYCARNGLIFVPVIFIGVAIGGLWAGALGASLGIGLAFGLKFMSLEVRTLLIISRCTRRDKRIEAAMSQSQST